MVPILIEQTRRRFIHDLKEMVEFLNLKDFENIEYNKLEMLVI